MPDGVDGRLEQGVVRYDLDSLIYLMQRLRDVEDGCPWDLKQTYKTIVPSTIEEAYEVADAVERGNVNDLQEELGDLMFQVVFYSQLAAEEARFDLNDIIHELVAKLVRRHPHVFPNGHLRARKSDLDVAEVNGESQIDVKKRWEALKEEERKNKGLEGVLDDVPIGLPALTRAQKLQKRAAREGFDWSSIAPVVGKVKEELLEVEEANLSGDKDAIEEEVGDLLFSCVNLARHLNVDAETALRRAGHKFSDRFTAMHVQHHAENPDVAFKSLTLAEMDALLDRQKFQSTPQSKSE